MDLDVLNKKRKRLTHLVCPSTATLTHGRSSLHNSAPFLGAVGRAGLCTRCALKVCAVSRTGSEREGE